MSKPKVSWLASLQSVLAAFIGVQSNKNRERDFQQGSFARFAIIGILATFAFVLIMWGIVALILSVASR